MNYIIADDSRTMRRVIYNSVKILPGDLKANEIMEAANGREAINCLKECGTLENTILLLDINMPKMGGMEALTQIRSVEEYNCIPIVMCTSEAERGTVLTAIKKGANQYIVKPFNQETLRKKLQGLYVEFFQHRQSLQS